MTTNTTTSSREEMLKYLIDIISDKEVIRQGNTPFFPMKILKAEGRLFFKNKKNEYKEIEKWIDSFLIYQHPVMLGDVIAYCEEQCLEWDIEKLYGVEYMPIGKINLPTNIFTLWEEKRKPITEQSDDCVKFVYNLISE